MKYPFTVELTIHESVYDVLMISPLLRAKRWSGKYFGPLFIVLVAESGRLGRVELLAKRPHGRLRRLSAELENVGEASGKPPTF